MTKGNTMFRCRLLQNKARQTIYREETHSVCAKDRYGVKREGEKPQRRYTKARRDEEGERKKTRTLGVEFP
jgi:hypothetical protein